VSFATLNLNPELLRAVDRLGFTEPTPIQLQAIPPVLAGRDVLACAMTGSGKSAAFLLPILHRLMGTRRGTTRVLVLAPTRELAAQITEHCGELAALTPLSSAAVFGGVPMSPQVQAFRRGVDVLVATPGRLLDHFSNSYARLEGLEVLVIDEADRMLDMGFLPDIRRILKVLPTRRQTLLFSATIPAPIAQLAREMLHEPTVIDVGRPSAPATGVTQSVFPVRSDLKSSLLLELLRTDEIGNVLVFTRTKHRANRLAEFLGRHGVACDRIHGNRSQAQRTAALAAFKRGHTRVLVATDIAARGIDVEALSHVVNFDVPVVPDDYIHRIGRTGRAAATGDAWTFVGEHEENDFNAIEKAIGRRVPRRKVAGFDYDRRAAERLEIPVAERLAALRAQRAQERANRSRREGAGRTGPGSGRGQSASSRRPSSPAGRSGNGGGGGQRPRVALKSSGDKSTRRG
jgi:ATP-dependent RNA helicase RhlE